MVAIYDDEEQEAQQVQVMAAAVGEVHKDKPIDVEELNDVEVPVKMEPQEEVQRAEVAVKKKKKEGKMQAVRRSARLKM